MGYLCYNVIEVRVVKIHNRKFFAEYAYPNLKRDSNDLVYGTLGYLRSASAAKSTIAEGMVRGVTQGLSQVLSPLMPFCNL